MGECPEAFCKVERVCRKAEGSDDDAHNQVCHSRTSAAKKNQGNLNDVKLTGKQVTLDAKLVDCIDRIAQVVCEELHSHGQTDFESVKQVLSSNLAQFSSSNIVQISPSNSTQVSSSQFAHASSCNTEKFSSSNRDEFSTSNPAQDLSSNTDQSSSSIPAKVSSSDNNKKTSNDTAHVSQCHNNHQGDLINENSLRFETSYDNGIARHDQDFACHGELANLNCESANAASEAWASPRISFSKDFVMSDMVGTSGSDRYRVSPEKRKWEHGNDHENEDDDEDAHSCGDFDFLRSNLCSNGTGDGIIDESSGFTTTMLSADELFSDGKLVPLAFSNWKTCDDFCLPVSVSTSSTTNVATTTSELTVHKSQHIRPMTRHLSFEIPNSIFHHSEQGDAFITTLSGAPPSPRMVCPEPTTEIPSEQLSSSSSTQSSSTSTTTSSSTLATSQPSRYSSKIKGLFKPKNSRRSSKEVPQSQLTRDNSYTATCRITPRSFWPFSRSNSAGESKTTTPPQLPCRSNSAGESSTARSKSFTFKRSDGHVSVHLSGYARYGQAPRSRKFQEECQQNDISDGANVDNLSDGTKQNGQPIKVADNSSSCNNLDKAVVNWTNKTKVSMTSIHRYRIRAAPAVGSFGKGSPGRRRRASGGGGVNVNSNKIVLRNLERCSAEKKLSRESFKEVNRRGSSYPRVSPVLNVALYRGGNHTKNGLFGLNSLFSSKKEKRPTEAQINWRKGA